MKSRRARLVQRALREEDKRRARPAARATFLMLRPASM